MRRIATTLSGLGFLWAGAATLYLLRGAGYATVTTVSALGVTDAAVGQVRVSLLSAEGVWIVALLSGVTLLAGLPVGVALTHPSGHRATALVVGGLLLGFSFLSGFSMGLPYLPAAAVVFAAGVVSPRHGRAG